MRQTDPMSRRTILKLAGATGAATLVAGCNGGPGDEDEEEDPAEPDDPDEEDPAEEDDPDEETEPDDDEADGDEEPIDPETEIMLDGETQAWMGVEPDEIADEENPTLTLQGGESYEITWENADGANHNIEIWDDDDEVVDDYETEIMDEEGETQTLEIDEVTDEMTQYVCEPHSTTMIGDIEVVEGENGEDEDAADDENGENGNGDEENGNGDEENGNGDENGENGNGNGDDENGNDEN
ncbi:copper-binding protein [Salinadaptatus halalkaliphilus]|uniref:Copper-binding protein n=1 Tax=Salinadaptatus halalkaliphilus TaxID=2419781 RepID=A0A4S3TK86_9EURY|nr:plastocyanin/azurin family copper-binding protein [Salinadaptatus halalkaliphilus]THE63335.1 copper-binding protein [Salinadaptatus halalkaliphilus]